MLFLSIHIPIEWQKNNTTKEFCPYLEKGYNKISSIIALQSLFLFKNSNDSNTPETGTSKGCGSGPHKHVCEKYTTVALARGKSDSECDVLIFPCNICLLLDKELNLLWKFDPLERGKDMGI